MDTRRLDLNLLLALEALLAERNVTKAAERLHISQPALSAQLARLRKLFGDPLFVPAQRGVIPTERALELQAPLQQALNEVRDLVNERVPFDAGTASFRVCVAASDYVQVALLLPLIVQWRKTAPGLRLALRNIDSRALARQAERGEVDLALLTPDGVPESLRSRTLCDERYVCVVRRGHPRVGRKLTLERFAELEQVIVSPRGGGFTGPTDAALAAHGKRREVVMSASSFLFVLELVASSDLLALVPERLLHGRAEPFRVLEPPLPIEGFSIAMAWHERSHHPPGVRWLREELLKALGPG